MILVRAAAALAVLLLISIGWFLRSDDTPHLQTRVSAPSSEHWAGTDHLGRDVLGRTLRATARAGAVALPAWAFATALGIFIGVIGAASGRKPLGKAIDWAIRVVFTTPFLLALVGLGVVFGRGTGTLFLVIALLGWAPAARYARAVARDTLGAPYTRAALSMGFNAVELAQHVLVPQCVRPVIAASGGLIAEILALDLALTLFGFGPPPPSPTLGSLLSDGLRFFSVAPWLMLSPLAMLCAVCACFRFILHDASPRLANHLYQTAQAEAKPI